MKARCRCQACLLGVGLASFLMMTVLEDTGGGGVEETALDASQRLLQAAEGRGRPRVRGSSQRVVPEAPNALMEVDREFTNAQLTDAAIAAEALAAAIGRPLMGARPPEPHVTDNSSLESVRDLPPSGVGLPDRNPSPEKKPRVNKAPQHHSKVPHFGGHHPPLFHGTLPAASLGNDADDRGKPLAAHVLPAARAPQHFQLDSESEPSWLAGLRSDLKDISAAQHHMAAQIHRLGEGQETLSRRAEMQEGALKQMQQELRELEREVQHLKSNPPTRSASPAASQRGGTRSGAGTPRYNGPPQVQEIDELQLVIGGWNEARRQDIEMDVQKIFENIRGTPLLGRIFVPYVRCSFCRVEVTYPEQDIWKQRKLQGVLVQSIKGLSYASQVKGQEGCRFWAARNRSVQERAKIRAILSTRDLCKSYLGGPYG